MTSKQSPQKKQAKAGELRQDLISGNWVVVAKSRAKRPDEFSASRPRPKTLPKYKAECPFCNLVKYPQRPDVLRLPDDPEKWFVHVFGNLYPAFSPKDEFRTWNVGPYRAIEAVGYHELMATHWHNQNEAGLSQRELSLMLEALIFRYRQLKTKPSVNYIQIIKNHGPEAGGSQEHPHHQIFTVPILPSDIAAILHGAEAYYQKTNQSIFATILDYELSSGERIIYQNEAFVAFCPFASRVNFEVWIMPRQHKAYFEDLSPEERDALADIMQQIFGRLYTGLNDPPYNYYIHSAPCDETGFVCNLEIFQHFRWHIEILPRFSQFAGFELGTGLEIITAVPEESAAFLREQKTPLHSKP